MDWQMAFWFLAGAACLSVVSMVCVALERRRGRCYVVMPVQVLNELDRVKDAVAAPDASMALMWAVAVYTHLAQEQIAGGRVVVRQVDGGRYQMPLTPAQGGKWFEVKG